MADDGRCAKRLCFEERSKEADETDETQSLDFGDREPDSEDQGAAAAPAEVILVEDSPVAEPTTVEYIVVIESDGFGTQVLGVQLPPNEVAVLEAAKSNDSVATRSNKPIIEITEQAYRKDGVLSAHGLPVLEKTMCEFFEKGLAPGLTFKQRVVVYPNYS